MDIESLRHFCNSLPAVTEDIKWEHDLCFCIGGKMFCVTSFEGPFGFTFKVQDEEFDALIARDGFTPAPYLARAKWVMVTDPSKLKKKEVEQYIRQSYDLIKAKLTKKVRKELKLE